ncbi:hypothetical protein JAAARDRAFT_135381 [Jaapia argillacea MUCL 33604]|uniref:MYND-type domain-containing protein n=1 Tax=Jaapia argillacea MUCL 33604 TaxID=933084 RepID=A0A067PHZ8_9AGAM|nr:hypothetical protein JAAARDRAFT_135381 [Jaapia argillacea MUCL 33604]
MAHPLFWPGQYYFYPIGNTSAVSLTRDLPPEAPADILLLGCGDARNILYTIFCEPKHFGRKLDFTCCDFDPAVLARNVLLFTMVADGESYLTIWNIFYHFKIDRHSHDVLVKQCKKLVAMSDTIQHWKSSPYAPFLKMCTDYTLAELRRHWGLYADMHELPQKRVDSVREAFDKQSRASRENITLIFSTSRSCGPLSTQGISVVSDQFMNYWKTGVTFTDQADIADANILNPTFAYSLGGEGYHVHYGTDPLISFHLAALLGNGGGSASVPDAVACAKSQFKMWCLAFRSSVASTSHLCIRCIVGEATVVCRTLHAHSLTGTLNVNLPIAPWKGEVLRLGADEYQRGIAPVTFNVIDTSNLDDHIALLNVLVTSIPLLSSEPASVLYAESLLFNSENPTKEFTDRLHADLTTMSLLLGLSPVDYLSGFTTRSNTHEVLTFRALKKKISVGQFHQVTTWKSPPSGDPIASRCAQQILPPVFDSRQLGTLFYDIYESLFGQEDAMTFFEVNRHNIQKAIGTSNLIHYIRESFVLFLAFVKDRLDVAEEMWCDVMDRFLALRDTRAKVPLSMDLLHQHDLCAQLYRHSVYTISPYRANPPKIGRFATWEAVPHLVRIILTVPREKLAVLEIPDGIQVGTPLLQGEVFSTMVTADFQHYFSSVDVAFGRAILVGSEANPRVVFEEDTKGWDGDSSLIASFTVPTRVLTDFVSPTNVNVALGIKSTPATLVSLSSKLGTKIILHSAKLMDDSHVYLIPEQPLPRRKARTSFAKQEQAGTDTFVCQIGESGAPIVELDEQCELVASLTSRIPITDEASQAYFGSGTMPRIAQISSSVLRLTLGGRIQDVAFPFPIIGSANKLRLARKSLYIEVAVPISRALKADGMKFNHFPVIDTGHSSLNPWSIHRINLSHLPILDLNAKNVSAWLNLHAASMFSTREQTLLKKREADALAYVKDTINTIICRFSGTQGTPRRQIFALLDKSRNHIDTILFIDNLRFDLASHTVVCDGYVLPLTPELMDKIREPFAKLGPATNREMSHVGVYDGELQAWKRLLPALVERCRSSWAHGDKCEYLAKGTIPLTDDMDTYLDPLCSCGRGKGVEGMRKVGLWKPFAPHVTRIAVSPLFAVSYLETVARHPDAHKCCVCRGRGKPKMHMCSSCKKVRYCSRECQKKDWNDHKPRCKAPSKLQ